MQNALRFRSWQGDPNGRPGGCGRGNVGLGVGHAAEGRSATRAHLGQTGELPRVNAHASLLALMAPIGMRALFQPPQPLQRRDLTITSTYRRSWSARPAREVGCSCTSISRLCSPRHAGGAGVMSGTQAQQAREMMAGVRPARAEQRKPPEVTSAAAARSFTSTSLGVPSTAGSQRRRPNARWAAVGEASEASRDTDVAVAHAHT